MLNKETWGSGIFAPLEIDHYGFDKDWKIGKERDKFFIIKSMCMEKSRFVEGVRASLLKAVLYGARVIPKYYID